MKKYYFFNEDNENKSFLNHYLFKLLFIILFIMLLNYFIFQYNFIANNNFLFNKVISYIKNKSTMTSHADDNNIINKVILPEWNLSFFYKSSDDSQINLDINEINENIDLFIKENIKKKFNEINVKELNEVMNLYSQITYNIYKLNLYSHLLFSQNSNDKENISLHAMIADKSSIWTSKLTFFKYKLYQISKEDLVKFNKNKEFHSKHYNYLIQNIIMYQNKELPEEIEKFNIEKSIANEQAVEKLYSQLLAKIEIDFENQKLNLSEAQALLTNKDRKVRSKVSNLLSKEFERNADLFLFIFNSLLKNRLIDDKWKNLEYPYQETLISYKIDKQILNTVVDAVTENYHQTSHRYYRIKAKILNLPKLELYDKNAPLPFVLNSQYSWNESVDLVNNTYDNFSSKTGELSHWFFDNQRIDAKIGKYKQSGGFATPFEQFILINFTNNLTSVTTLAHEIGHTIQMKLSGDKYGKLLTSAPIPLAEVPSTFGETLLVQNILQNTKDKKEKNAILSSQIEHALDSISRQIAFHIFENKIYELRQQRELSLNDIQTIWLETMSQQLGDSVEFDNKYQNYWIYISHFIGSRFYTFSYAFAQLTSYALLDIYNNSFKNNTNNEFVEKYLEFMQDSSVKSVNELLGNFNIDPNDKLFWNNGMKYVEKMIDELENNLE